ncbi:MAG: PQQ-dependent sugar dehydrogenase [Actinomycetia bacterium]|nr:PQQ-dependent sugar dehydrogenase [Actinomycetes bacterium]
MPALTIHRPFLVLIGFVMLASACTSTSTPTTTKTDSPTTTIVSIPAPLPDTTLPDGEPSSSSTPASRGQSLTSLDALQLALVATDSDFAAPVLLRADPDGGQDFVVEQPGRIVRADGGEHRVALDIRDDVLFEGEQGLLGLAFHPDFAVNGLAYVNYVDTTRQTVVEAFVVSDGVFDAATRRRVITIPQPAANHNGGMIEFGPAGNLWIGMGDGGASNDKFRNGQRADTLLGSMLRIRVGPGIDTYEIPVDNPFADGESGSPEVWAVGLRNPWRFTIDGDAVWIADVGQDLIEEVNLADASIPAINYGWPIAEGDHCFQDECDMRGLHLPTVVYEHPDGCSVTGGVVYRGDSIPEIDGHYFYSDFCTGFIRSHVSGEGSFDWTPVTGNVQAVSAFGIGGDGELYVVSRQGTIFKLVVER